jgi:hypothetical protein
MGWMDRRGISDTLLVDRGRHYHAGPLGTAASLHAALAIHNVTPLKASWVNRGTETDVVWPYPEVVEDYALPLKGPGPGIEANAALVDEALAASKPFVSSLQPWLDGLDGAVRDFRGRRRGPGTRRQSALQERLRLFHTSKP